MNKFLVGGYVRDKILGIDSPDSERDWLVVGATPEQMIESGYTPVGKEFPVFLHPETKEEYALARTERKISKGYKGFSFHTAPDITIEEDLLRRDLTINSIAEDENGQLIDPYGGQKDIEARILRHVSPAFSEDPLRVLRLARFAAQFKQMGFNVAPETIKLCREIAQAGELETLVPERIWQELLKALDSDSPETFIETLREAKSLEIIFPEIDALFGIEQRADFHPEVDTGVHILLCLKQSVVMGASKKIRFAVLCHDLGKALTPKEELPRHIGHEARSRKVTITFCERLRAPKEFQHLAEVVAEYHLLCHTALELRAKTILKLFKNISAFKKPENLDNFLLACEIDARGRTGLEDRDYPPTDFLKKMFSSAYEIDSSQVDQQKYQGKAFGEQMDKLRTQAIETAKQKYHQDH